MAWFFPAIQWQTIQVASGRTSSPGGFFSLPLVIVFIVGVPLVMLAIIVIWVKHGQ